MIRSVPPCDHFALQCRRIDGLISPPPWYRSDGDAASGRDFAAGR
jgi:hypothetical protein